jgi:acetoin utilization protein AcuC
MADSPLIVFGPRSLTYDFGPSHPLTPRRFGPGIDLLRGLGAEPGLAPEPAADRELLTCHTPQYLGVVKRFSESDADPWAEPEAGIGLGDDPPFHGMHGAAAAVAGGSIRAMDAIIAGGAEHAFHPGGGLHHAMPSRASGFCIYNDPALAVARAREAGLRVLYVDLDVHHGDGVQEIHRSDPDVLTLSFHESGRYLFPGTGFVGEMGDGRAAGTVVNLPLEPETGEGAWLAAVSSLLPELAATFRPDIVVSQHGCDTHAWDPLAHLNVTTTAMGAAARLVDRVAHSWARGRWLATGGGGYGVYRVVPRAWAHVWLAASHRDGPDRLPDGWRDRWSAEAARYGDPSLPETLDDAPNAGLPVGLSQASAEAQSSATASLVRRLVVPRLVREAVDRGWWSPFAEEAPAASLSPSSGGVELFSTMDAGQLSRLELAPRVVAVDLPSLAAAVASGELSLSVAVSGTRIVGLVASAREGANDGGTDPPRRAILAVGVAPGFRRRGLATELLRAHLDAAEGTGDAAWTASVTVAERDPVEPLDVATRVDIARRLLEGARFKVSRSAGPIGRADPLALDAIRD